MSISKKNIKAKRVKSAKLKERIEKKLQNTPSLHQDAEKIKPKECPKGQKMNWLTQTCEDIVSLEIPPEESTDQELQIDPEDFMDTSQWEEGPSIGNLGWSSQWHGWYQPSVPCTPGFPQAWPECVCGDKHGGPTWVRGHEEDPTAITPSHTSWNISYNPIGLHYSVFGKYCSYFDAHWYPGWPTDDLRDGCEFCGCTWDSGVCNEPPDLVCGEANPQTGHIGTRGGGTGPNTHGFIDWWGEGHINAPVLNEFYATGHVQSTEYGVEFPNEGIHFMHPDFPPGDSASQPYGGCRHVPNAYSGCCDPKACNRHKNVVDSPGPVRYCQDRGWGSGCEDEIGSHTYSDHDYPDPNVSIGSFPCFVGSRENRLGTTAEDNTTALIEFEQQNSGFVCYNHSIPEVYLTGHSGGQTWNDVWWSNKKRLHGAWDGGSEVDSGNLQWDENLLPTYGGFLFSDYQTDGEYQAWAACGAFLGYEKDAKIGNWINTDTDSEVRFAYCYTVENDGYYKLPNVRQLHAWNAIWPPIGIQTLWTKYAPSVPPRANDFNGMYPTLGYCFEDGSCEYPDYCRDCDGNCICHILPDGSCGLDYDGDGIEDSNDMCPTNNWDNCGVCEGNNESQDLCGVCNGDNSTCTPGCTILGACNYDMLANTPVGELQCDFPWDYCDNPESENFGHYGCCFSLNQQQVPDENINLGRLIDDNVGGAWLRLSLTLPNDPQNFGWAITSFYPETSCFTEEGTYMLEEGEQGSPAYCKDCILKQPAMNLITDTDGNEFTPYEEWQFMYSNPNHHVYNEDSCCCGGCNGIIPCGELFDEISLWPSYYTDYAHDKSYYYPHRVSGLNPLIDDMSNVCNGNAGTESQSNCQIVRDCSDCADSFNRPWMGVCIGAEEHNNNLEACCGQNNELCDGNLRFWQKGHCGWQRTKARGVINPELVYYQEDYDGFFENPDLVVNGPFGMFHDKTFFLYCDDDGQHLYSELGNLSTDINKYVCDQLNELSTETSYTWNNLRCTNINNDEYRSLDADDWIYFLDDETVGSLSGAEDCAGPCNQPPDYDWYDYNNFSFNSDFGMEWEFKYLPPDIVFNNGTSINFNPLNNDSKWHATYNLQHSKLRENTIFSSGNGAQCNQQLTFALLNKATDAYPGNPIGGSSLVNSFYSSNNASHIEFTFPSVEEYENIGFTSPQQNWTSWRSNYSPFDIPGHLWERKFDSDGNLTRQRAWLYGLVRNFNTWGYSCMETGEWPILHTNYPGGTYDEKMAEQEWALSWTGMGKRACGYNGTEFHQGSNIFPNECSHSHNDNIPPLFIDIYGCPLWTVPDYFEMPVVEYGPSNINVNNSNSSITYDNDLPISTNENLYMAVGSWGLHFHHLFSSQYLNYQINEDFGNHSSCGQEYCGTVGENNNIHPDCMYGNLSENQWMDTSQWSEEPWYCKEEFKAHHQEFSRGFRFGQSALHTPTLVPGTLDGVINDLPKCVTKYDIDISSGYNDHSLKEGNDFDDTITGVWPYKTCGSFAQDNPFNPHFSWNAYSMTAGGDWLGLCPEYGNFGLHCDCEAGALNDITPDVILNCGELYNDVGVIWNSQKQLDSEQELTIDNPPPHLVGYSGAGRYPYNDANYCSETPIEHYFQLPIGNYQIIFNDNSGQGLAGYLSGCSDWQTIGPREWKLDVSTGNPGDDNNWENLVHVTSGGWKRTFRNCDCTNWAWHGMHCEASNCKCGCSSTLGGYITIDGPHCANYDEDHDCDDSCDALCSELNFTMPVGEGVQWGRHTSTDTPYMVQNFIFDVPLYGCTDPYYTGVFCPQCTEECPPNSDWCISCEEAEGPSSGNCLSDDWEQCYSPGTHQHDIDYGLEPGDACPLCCPPGWNILELGCYLCPPYC